MTMGTRIVVMKDGEVQQIDTPVNLFDRPVNTFVAGFIGTPQMNMFRVGLRAAGEDIGFTFIDGSRMAFLKQASDPWRSAISTEKSIPSSWECAAKTCF